MQHIYEQTLNSYDRQWWCTTDDAREMKSDTVVLQDVNLISLSDARPFQVPIAINEYVLSNNLNRHPCRLFGCSDIHIQLKSNQYVYCVSLIWGQQKLPIINVIDRGFWNMCSPQILTMKHTDNVASVRRCPSIESWEKLMHSWDRNGILIYIEWVLRHQIYSPIFLNLTKGK